MSIRFIAHLSDIHIPKLHKRHSEYRGVFERTCNMLSDRKPDRITLVGDLFHDKLNISNEANMLAAEFIQSLSSIAPVRLTRGNHDFNILRKDRIDCIQTLVDLIQNPNVKYYNKSGFFIDENVIWTVWHHGDHFSPWNQLLNPSPEHENEFHSEEIISLFEQYETMEDIREAYKFIDLFHDPVSGCKLFNGMELSKESYLNIKDFKGDYCLMGDIHLRQSFTKEGKPASLIKG
jgi:predicted MPP superfamily phosphohydrolase